jgi:NADH:ubiquinone oxidoreductase subunit F (NADH-binding)/NADH:ubiquinone oxidoreductase subunit E/NAD-dependent dihydropyrimidine dehydrogenase PreA subunit
MSRPDPDSLMMATIDQILEKYPDPQTAVITILQDIQLAFHYLPAEALEYVCEKSGISPASITGISTFFNQFRHKKAGEHIIRVCNGTACHVKGSMQVYDAIRRSLHIEGEEDTDATGMFTIETVACLGCCTLAPVVQIDTLTYGHVSARNVDDILQDFRERRNNQVSTIETMTTENDQKRDVIALQDEIRIGLGSCCVASGSGEVKAALEKTIADAGLKVTVKQVGCVGICNQVPVLEIVKAGEPAAFYAKIQPDEVRNVVLQHFRPDTLLKRMKTRLSGLFEHVIEEDKILSYKKYGWEQRDTPISGFLGPQLPLATENRGVLKPCDLEEYKKAGGFEALRKCLESMSPEVVVDEIIDSGLRGRGGAGFPTGRKWKIMSDQPGPEKYLICNGDEGDPGAFMDRMLLESYPFRIIEGMIIAAFATAATEGIFYIRAEYPLAVKRIREALTICEQNGILGTSVLGSRFAFQIRIFEGAGAFVCGEETALIASLEGRRGTPGMRPPYPAVSGFHGKPTLINNTETFSLVPWIIKNGAAAFTAIGTAGSKGTKVFALAGKVNRGGLIEVPMGVSIRQIVEEIGGGIPNNRKFKAVQIGGPSGGCIPAELAELPVDFEALIGAGSMMGSGGLIVLDENDCMVDIAHFFLSFTQNESCGRCTFCRIGTTRMLEILEKIRNGKAIESDLTKLEKLAYSTQKGSLCGLGKTAPNPVLSTLKYFREEYEAHLQGHCPSGKCLPLITYSITTDCIGCTKCAQQCPTSAIAFKPYEIHLIENEKCIKCDICRQVCPVQSVIVQ